MSLQLEPSWNAALSNVAERPYFMELSDKVERTYETKDIWPKKAQIFNAFEKCPFDRLKVVLLGQDPYPTPGHAHGLCFSVPENINPLAKSIQNIFKEIHSDLGIDVPSNGNLERWADQGVFLLNTVLTVEAHTPNSHKKLGWEKFTDEVIKTISNQRDGVVFLLWGAQAQKKATLIDQTKHHILSAPHPSPLSAYRGFFGCKHFSKTNELLALQKQSLINW